MSTWARSSGASTRSPRTYLQLGLAALGAIVILWSIVQLVIISASMSSSESGFAEGLAIMLYGLYVLAGFVLLAIGLLLPQREGEGIQFSPRQRRLLLYGAIAPIMSVLIIPIGSTVTPPLTEPVVSLLVAILAAFILSGPVATLLAVGLKLLHQMN